MPYKREGNRVLHKKGGTWKIKQSCKDANNAKKAIRLLRGVEHGMVVKKK